MKKPRFLEFGLFVIELDWKGCKPSALSNQGHFAVNRTTFPKNIWCTWLPTKTISQSRLLGGNIFTEIGLMSGRGMKKPRSQTLNRVLCPDPYRRILIRFPKGLRDFWITRGLVRRHGPWHMSIVTTSLSSRTATPQLHTTRQHGQRRAWTWKESE